VHLGDHGSAAMSEPPLRVLGDRLRTARVEVARLRHDRAAAADMSVARERLLDALDAYVRGLERLGLPIPRTMRAEQRLYRKLYD